MMNGAKYFYLFIVLFIRFTKYICFKILSSKLHTSNLARNLKVYETLSQSTNKKQDVV